VRNYLFNARNFFALKRDTLKRNQFGGTLGGPIAKNKLFFFAGYQGTKTSSNPSDKIDYIPTAAMMAGTGQLSRLRLATPAGRSTCQARSPITASIPACTADRP